MSLVPSCRALAALTLAATLSAPASAQPLPSADREEPRSSLQQILDGPAGWVRTLVTLWGASGSSLDPSGASANTDGGPTLDPDGNHSTGDNGSGLDPDGRT